MNQDTKIIGEQRKVKIGSIEAVLKIANTPKPKKEEPLEEMAKEEPDKNYEASKGTIRFNYFDEKTESDMTSELQVSNLEALLKLYNNHDLASKKEYPNLTSWITKLLGKGYIEANSNSITKVNLSSEGLKEFPEELLELPKIMNIGLSNNGIEKIPEKLYELEYLEELYIGNNKIKEVDGRILTMGRFRRIDMRNNPLTDNSIAVLKEFHKEKSKNAQYTEPE